VNFLNSAIGAYLCQKSMNTCSCAINNKIQISK
jgi:hypothetical protein